MNYWKIVQERAAECWVAHTQPGASSLAGLPAMATHAEQFGFSYTLHVAQMLLSGVVFKRCPDQLRTAGGVPDLQRLVLDSADAITTLTAAEDLRAVRGMRLDEALEHVEDLVSATAHARVAVQSVLEQVAHDAQGWARMLDIFYELRDDPSAIAGVLALTGNAMHAVVTPQSRNTTNGEPT
ncbi:hypothetical protein [Streptomyces sp. NPDC088775]|uniref:hypothetical protein n=1 Tax=Streptomyces sp. NPDC088775 TaxID=3365896 RepID=UPI00380BA78B